MPYGRTLNADYDKKSCGQQNLNSPPKQLRPIKAQSVEVRLGRLQILRSPWRACIRASSPRRRLNLSGRAPVPRHGKIHSHRIRPPPTFSSSPLLGGVAGHNVQTRDDFQHPGQAPDVISCPSSRRLGRSLNSLSSLPCCSPCPFLSLRRRTSLFL